MTDFKEYSELFHAYDRRPTPKPSIKVTVDQGDMLLVDRFRKIWNAMAFKPEQNSSVADSLYRRMEKCCAEDRHIKYRPGCCNPFNRGYSFSSDPGLRDDLRAFLNKYEPAYRHSPNYK